MTLDALDISVLGIGHLAAAVRMQLSLLGLSPACASHPARPLVVACSDYACTSSFADANRRALASGSPILFAWISAGRVELGPLVVPLESPCFECQPSRRWDFSLINECTKFPCAWVSRAPRTTLNPDTRLKSVARFGASLVTRELVGLRLGAPTARLVGRVAKFDPPCTHPQVVTLTRAPDCPACGGPARGFPASGDSRGSVV
jgi:bacteriocin biosynthesis cyclodehydratase domain-containing protein